MNLIVLDEADIRVDEFRTTARNPIHVRMTHIPSGWTGEGVAFSPIRARRLARLRLELAVEDAEALDSEVTP